MAVVEAEAVAVAEGEAEAVAAVAAEAVAATAITGEKAPGKKIVKLGVKADSDFHLSTLTN